MVSYKLLYHAKARFGEPCQSSNSHSPKRHSCDASEPPSNNFWNRFFFDDNCRSATTLNDGRDQILNNPRIYIISMLLLKTLMV